MNDEEIHALPESSSEDDGAVTRSDVEFNDRPMSSGTKRKSQDDGIAFWSKKRVKTSGGSKKHSIDTKRRPDSRHEQTKTILFPSGGIDDWVLSSQQGRSQSSQGKKKETYGKRSNVSRSSEAVSTENGFTKIPEDAVSFEDDPIEPSTKVDSKFVKLDDAWVSPSKPRKRTKARIEILPADIEPKAKPSKFIMPYDIEDESRFAEELPSRSMKRRTGSASSSALSEVDSVVELLLTQEQKDKLIAVDSPSFIPELPPNHIRCPICAQAVSKKVLTDPMTQKVFHARYPSKLPLQQQQDFCYQHQVYDAQAEWIKKAYPSSIDWQDLENRRIPKHIARLRKILYRKQQSHYLDLLESRISEACGNKTKIKRYLNEGLIDTVKTGYYGPRGAKIIAHVVTEHMSKPLRMQQKADKTVMATGVSGFVSAVLLPEVAELLVTEDMNLSDRGQARSILDESAGLGLLLCPDDDHVERQDDD